MAFHSITQFLPNVCPPNLKIFVSAEKDPAGNPAGSVLFLSVGIFFGYLIDPEILRIMGLEVQIGKK